MTFLSKLLAAREFTLPPFDLEPLAFELRSSAEEDELILDRIVSVGDGQPNVIALSRPVPTAGELHQSVERHLGRAGEAPARAADGADELREALADLRRSLG